MIVRLNWDSEEYHGYFFRPFYWPRTFPRTILSINLFAYLLISPSMCIYIYMYVCLSTYLSIYLSICLCFHPSVDVSIHLYIYLCSIYLRIYRSTYSPIYLPVEPLYLGILIESVKNPLAHCKATFRCFHASSILTSTRQDKQRVSRIRSL